MSQSTVFQAGQFDYFDHRPVRMLVDLTALLAVAGNEFERDREAARASLTKAATILSSELQRHAATAKPDSGRGELAGWQAQRVRTYIDGHLGDVIRVSDLSSIARRSTAHFFRAFKRTFGQTPHAYVTTRRLHHAKALMLDGEERLSVIALICGFADQAHFSNVFRQYTHETPGAWRRRHAWQAGRGGPATAETGGDGVRRQARGAFTEGAERTSDRAAEFLHQADIGLWR